MSDYYTNDEVESKLSLVVRKPQEGKTFICINTIANDDSKDIHIVLTMNTLSAGMQFFGRMEEIIGSKRILVFNSNKKTAGNCFHSKSIHEVLGLISCEDIKVIVCCANTLRIRESIPLLLAKSTHKFKIHIDEAHKYIPENKEQIRSFNESPAVNGIVGYSASPDQIWSLSSSDSLFHKILIRNVDEELNMIRSPHYFGVNRCKFEIYDDLCHTKLVDDLSLTMSENISDTIYERARMTSKNRTWFKNNYYFDLGNEMLLFAFMEHVLPLLQLPQNSFSYNFTPAYSRKATHYQMCEIILKHYPNANVIISNGNYGGALYRMRDATKQPHIIKTSDMIKNDLKNLPTETERNIEFKKLLEPSYLVQQLIKETPDCPTFVTGLFCVGMSITLINSELGNFDNVVMAHHHYSKDKIYQLCRFLFNYTSWSQESREKIKQTVFHSLTVDVVDICSQYEEHIEKMSTDFAGKVCSLREIQGLEPEEPTERERKRAALSSVKNTNAAGKLFKKFKVYDDNDCEQWDKAEKFYEEIMGKKISGKSKLQKNENGFWECSTTSHVAVQTTKTVNNLEGQSWWSTFQLISGRLNYARVFVGYENLDDFTEYTIYIKFVVLEDTENTREVLQKYGKKNKKNVVSSSSTQDNSSDNISISSDNSSDNSSISSDNSDSDSDN